MPFHPDEPHTGSDGGKTGPAATVPSLEHDDFRFDSDLAIIARSDGDEAIHLRTLSSRIRGASRRRRNLSPVALGKGNLSAQQFQGEGGLPRRCRQLQCRFKYFTDIAF